MSPILIFSVVLGYFLLLMVIAQLTAGKSNDKDFFIGSKKSPWYLVAFGMIGASLSGVTFISIPGVIGNLESANGQFSYMQMVFGYLVGYTFIALVLMPMYYRLNLTSIYTYLEKRFGIVSYKTGALFFLLSRTIGASFRLFLVAIVLQEFICTPMGIPFPATVLIILALIYLYTFKGGIRTIVYTDTLQTLFMLLAVVFTLGFIATELDVSSFGLIDVIQNSDYSQMFFFEDASKGNYFWKQFLAGAAIATVMTGLDQDMMQKNNSCKNIGDAQKNMFSFSLILVIVNFLFVGLGALLYIYSAEKGIVLPERTDLVFSTLALNHFSPLIGIIFLIGLLAAAFSSADSALTALTTSFCVDFLDFEKKPQNETSAKTRTLVHLSFASLLFVVILIFNYALERDVVSSLFTIAGFTYGPLLGMFMFGLFTKRTVNDKMVLGIAIVSITISYYLKTYAPIWFNHEIGFEILIYNGMITFILLFLSSLSIKQNNIQL